MIIKRKENPAVDSFLKRAMPKYRKHSVIIVESDSVTPQTTYWDGGSINYYDAYSIAGAHLGRVRAPTAPPQFGGGEARAFPIDDFTVVIRAGVFRGKTATVSLHATKDTLRKFGLNF